MWDYTLNYGYGNNIKTVYDNDWYHLKKILSKIIGAAWRRWPHFFSLDGKETKDQGCAAYVGIIRQLFFAAGQDVRLKKPLFAALLIYLEDKIFV